MVAELLTVSHLAYHGIPGAGVRLGLTTLIWIATVTLSVPIHRRLLSGYNQKEIDHLILTNWPRTVLWTVKSLICLYLYKA